MQSLLDAILVVSGRRLQWAGERGKLELNMESSGFDDKAKTEMVSKRSERSTAFPEVLRSYLML